MIIVRPDVANYITRCAFRAIQEKFRKLPESLSPFALLEIEAGHETEAAWGTGYRVEATLARAWAWACSNSLDPRPPSSRIQEGRPGIDILFAHALNYPKNLVFV